MLDNILCNLPSMSHTELKQIHTMTTTLLGNTKPREKSTNYAKEQQLYMTIENKLKRKFIKIPPFEMFIKNPKYKNYKKGSIAVDIFIAATWPKINRTQRLRIYDVLVSLLISTLFYR